MGSENVFIEDIADAETSQRRAKVIAKKDRGLVTVEATFIYVLAQQVRAGFPQWADALFVALAVLNADARGRFEGKVAGHDIDNFLNASTGVEHQGEQDVVATSQGGAAINLGQDGLEFVELEVFDDACRTMLEGDCQDLLR